MFRTNLTGANITLIEIHFPQRQEATVINNKHT